MTDAPPAVQPLTLMGFLLARIADDEEDARHVLALRGSGTDYDPSHPMDPARVLAECAAKRRIVEMHTPTEFYRHAEDTCPSCADSVGRLDSDWESYPCQTIRALASIYADHPDFREEWRA